MMNKKRLSGETGVSIVEAPVILIVIAFLAIGVLGFVQVFMNYQHLTSAARSAARYATKADYDPTNANSQWNARPSTCQVIAYAQKADPELTPQTGDPCNPAQNPFTVGNSTISVQVCNDPAHDAGCSNADNATADAGWHTHVNVESQVSEGPYTLIAGLVDGLGDFFGGGDVLPRNVKLHSEAVAAYE